MVKANWLAAERLRKKSHRAEETTEEHAAWQQIYMPFCVRCSHQACSTVAPACIRCGHIYNYKYIFIYISFIHLIYLIKSRIGRDH